MEGRKERRQQQSREGKQEERLADIGDGRIMMGDLHVPASSSLLLVLGREQRRDDSSREGRDTKQLNPFRD